MDMKCSPNNYLFQDESGKINLYPLCSSWCLDWYTSCKNVFTCSNNPFIGSSAQCSDTIDGTCKTVSEIFDQGSTDSIASISFCYQFFGISTITILADGDNCVMPGKGEQL